jgi:hypothetical protein
VDGCSSIPNSSKILPFSTIFRLSLGAYPAIYTVRIVGKFPEARVYRIRRYATSREVIEFSFSIYLILPSALGPGVHSASNRNEY